MRTYAYYEMQCSLPENKQIQSCESEQFNPWNMSCLIPEE